MAPAVTPTGRVGLALIGEMRHDVAALWEEPPEAVSKRLQGQVPAEGLGVSPNLILPPRVGARGLKRSLETTSPVLLSISQGLLS
jgi:hypothetical protein